MEVTFSKKISYNLVAHKILYKTVLIFIVGYNKKFCQKNRKIANLYHIQKKL